MIYQIQEMIRVETIEDEVAINHEIKTYNQLLPKKYELTATLLIEVENEEVRKIKLRELLGIEKHIYMNVDKEKLNAVFDDEQFNQERISSVQFIRFNLGKDITKKFMNTDSIQLVSTHPYYNFSQQLNSSQISALRDDLN